MSTSPAELPPNATGLLANRSLSSLKGVGPAVQEKLQALGITSIQDLLFHFPLRYQDRTRVYPIGSIRLGDNVLLQGEIVSSEIQFGKRRSLHCVVSDGSGFINLRFFHFSGSQKSALSSGQQIRCFGEARRGKSGLELYHPEYRLVRSDEPAEVEDHYTPIYPVTEGLQQKRLRGIIDQSLTMLMSDDDVEDYLPAQLQISFNRHSLREAIQLIHKPPADTPQSWLVRGGHPALRRLSFEELLAHRVCMRKLRQSFDIQAAPSVGDADQLVSRFLTQLPFSLTSAQNRVVSEISNDLRSPGPMLRLVQGDVGSGKTLIAALATLQVIFSKYQVALMAPTEILAEQHYENFSAWFSPLGIHVGWLSGKTKGKKRSEQLSNLVEGDTQLIVGTHALFQDGVEFQRLGLVIVDEQHRFGVHQRMSLRNKANTQQETPHQLVMTATPIPRTLAMSAYADLDCSVIDELPPGRTPVNTVVLSNDRREEVIDRIATACANQNQVYWVCTLIEESEALQCQAAEVTWAELAKQLPDHRIALIHGRMKPAEKLAIMNGFKMGDIQLLVATTVIEVGVDVPNASLMVIENAERLGLAQLHQLRGRVGRGAKASHCILMYQSPLSNIGKQRLTVMRESNDGFYIAEKDMEIRGPGQMLGTEQTGLMSFKVADISRDALLLDDVKTAADFIFSDHPTLIDKLVHRWVADREQYGQV